MDEMIIRIGLVALVGLAVLIALASIPSRGKRERNALRATRSHPRVVRHGSRSGDGGYHGAYSVGHDSGGGWAAPPTAAAAVATGAVVAVALAADLRGRRAGSRVPSCGHGAHRHDLVAG
jgi:hypothetical protein